MRIQLSAALLFIAISGVSYAEGEIITARAPSLKDALPAEAQKALSEAPKVDSIFSVNSRSSFDGAVLRVDQLVFKQGSTLELTNTSAPFLIVAAKKVIISDPTVASILRGKVIELPFAAAGSNGAHGSNGVTSGRHGSNGGNGSAGGKGQDGKMPSPSPIYFVVNEVVAGSPEQVPSTLNLRFEFPGSPGSEGGKGGRGGNGGRGGDGRRGQDGHFDCRSGPGDGGNGGNGGNGGPGGKGGDGSSGRTLTFYGPASVTKLLPTAFFDVSGGYGGGGGSGGGKGLRGAKGQRGGDSKRCHGGAHDGGEGADGVVGQPGQNGSPGGQVPIRVVTLDEVPVF